MARMLPLPIDAHLDAIRTALTAARAVVVVAAPGAGKTTRVPPALAADGPRHRAAAAARGRAGHRAPHRGRARLDDRRRGRLARPVRAPLRPRTRACCVATEGILTARLQQTRSLSRLPDDRPRRVPRAQRCTRTSGWRWRGRPGGPATTCGIVVMSATIEADAGGAFLGGCPVIEVPGAPHPAGDRVRAGRDGGRGRRDAAGAIRRQRALLPARRAGDSIARTPRSRRAVPRGRRRAAPRRRSAPTNRIARCRRRRRRGASSWPPTSRRRRSRCRASTRSSIPACTRWRATTPRARIDSAGDRAHLARRAPISGPAEPPASALVARAGSGTRAIACGRIASPTSGASISPAPSSIWLAWGARSANASTGSRRRRPPRSRPRAISCAGSARSRTIG